MGRYCRVIARIDGEGLEERINPQRMQKRIDLTFCLIVLPAMIAIFPVERWVQNFPFYTISVLIYLYLLYFINRRLVIPQDN